MGASTQGNKTIPQLSTPTSSPTQILFHGWDANNPTGLRDVAVSGESLASSFSSNVAPETFTSGVNFTNGVTTALTLLNMYVSTSNMDVFFDGTYQGVENYSLSGRTLTFTSPIPVGIQKVYVHGGAVRTIGAPTDGTVIDSSLSSSSKLYSHNAGLNFLTDPPYNGVGNGSTDNTSAITAAEAVGAAYLPPGVFKSASLASASLTGPFSGIGQIMDSAGNKRGKIFNQVTSRPSPLSPQTSIETNYNGDLTHQPFSIEHRISGAGTLGAPTFGGYINNPETAAYQAHMLNTSGAVNGNGLGAGRTAAQLHFVNVYQYGQADCHAYAVNAFVATNNPSATNINAAPAACLFTGQATAGISGCYLNPVEIDCVDNGFDVAAVGFVSNCSRTVSTAALGAWWYGFRQQSIGTQPVDVAFSATGLHKFGLDLSYCNFGTNNSAISLAADQKIYGNVTATDPTGRYPVVTGDFFSYSSVSSGWVFSVSNSPSLIITSAQVSTPLVIESDIAFKVSSNQVVGARIAGYGTPTGSSRISNFPGASATLLQTSQMLAALMLDLKTHGLIGA
jgi:hypothetical protein